MLSERRKAPMYAKTGSSYSQAVARNWDGALTQVHVWDGFSESSDKCDYKGDNHCNFHCNLAEAWYSRIIGILTNHKVNRVTACERERTKCVNETVLDSYRPADPWRWDSACQEWGAYVYGFECQGDGDCACLGCRLPEKGFGQ